ncbi:endolysin [Streptomyces phage Treat]|nr:endolysin [Streptomyces phage Treat]
MARFSKAKWKPVRNYTNNGQDRVLGLIVHIMQGTLEGSQSWFDNPSAQASSHFGTGKDGELRQWVDTSDRAWAQAAGNRDYLSIENEGKVPDKLTAKQIEAVAQTFAWVCKTYKVPYQVADKPGEKGLGFHRMGGAAWGGHSCPGDNIIKQLPEIVARAKEINKVTAKPKPVYAPFPGKSFFRLGQKHKLITELGKALVKAGYKGYKVGPGQEFTRADIKAVAWFQRKQGWTGADADGYPGPETWKRLKVAQPK